MVRHVHSGDCIGCERDGLRTMVLARGYSGRNLKSMHHSLLVKLLKFSWPQMLSIRSSPMSANPILLANLLIRMC
jgi:hypothetical protein